MAKVQNPVIGRSKGSAGGMTFAKVYDKNVMKAKIFEASNPNTAAQQTQRDFFRNLSDIIAGITDKQLMTLFGQKPKGMSRRNALSKQVAAANTTADGVKSVDFSKLKRIGNGVTCNAALYHTASVAAGAYALEETANTLGIAADSTANFVMVIFNVTKNTISLVNTQLNLSSQNFNAIGAGCAVGDNIYYYPTVSTKDTNVSSLDFGSFIIKTRPEKTGRNIQKSAVNA